MTAHDDTAPRAAHLMRLLTPHHDKARGAARRLCRSNADGDYLFQETVLQAFDHLGELEDEARFRAWFYAVMLSVHRARHRQSFWRRLVPFVDGDGHDDEREPSRPAEAESLDGAERMAGALATLAPEAREAIVLFELEGFSLEEIAALQKVSLSAVKSRLARGRERLAQHYERLERASQSAGPLRNREPIAVTAVPTASTEKMP